jgi:hypothetical protein
VEAAAQRERARQSPQAAAGVERADRAARGGERRQHAVVEGLDPAHRVGRRRVVDGKGGAGTRVRHEPLVPG